MVGVLYKVDERNDLRSTVDCLHGMLFTMMYSGVQVCVRERVLSLVWFGVGVKNCPNSSCWNTSLEVLV